MDSGVMKLATWDDNSSPEWLSQIDWVEYEKLAAVGYQPEQIAMYYNIKKQEFMYYFMLLDSVLKFHYDRGVLFHQAKEGMDMLDDAGLNATTAQRLDKLRKKIDFRTKVDQIIYGGF